MAKTKTWLTLALVASVGFVPGAAQALSQGPVAQPITVTSVAPLAAESPGAVPVASPTGVPATALNAPVSRASATPTAATAAMGAANSAAEQLARLQMESLILAAKAKNAKLAADIRSAEKEAGQASTALALAAPLPTAAIATGAGIAGIAAIPGATSPGLSAMKGLDLVAIRAYDGRYLASIDVGGRTVEKGEGETLDGGWKVAAIGAHSVKLVRRKAGKDEVRTLGL